MVIKVNKYQRIANYENLRNITRQNGFTLLETMIVFMIVSVIAAFAIPAYKNYVIESKRTDMMIELQNRAAIFESLKMKKGAYKNLKTTDLSDLNAQFPLGKPLYDINITSLDESGTTITAPPYTDSWTFTAIPINGGQMEEDGKLSLSYQNIKCREISSSDKRCGTGDQWKK